MGGIADLYGWMREQEKKLTDPLTKDMSAADRMAAEMAVDFTPIVGDAKALFRDMPKYAAEGQPLMAGLAGLSAVPILGLGGDIIRRVIASKRAAKHLTQLGEQGRKLRQFSQDAGSLGLVPTGMEGRWYSKPLRTVEEAAQDKMPASEWLTTIEKKGKTEDLVFSGLKNNLMDFGDTVLDKDQVFGLYDPKGVKFSERISENHGGPFKRRDQEQKLMKLQLRSDDAHDALEAFADDIMETRRLMNKGAVGLPPGYNSFEEMEAEFTRLKFFAEEAKNDYLHALSEGPFTSKSGLLMSPIHESIVFDRMNASGQVQIVVGSMPKSGNIVSGFGTHWLQSHGWPQNQLFHIRGVERHLADGRKVFHVEEIQSDIGQAWRGAPAAKLREEWDSASVPQEVLERRTQLRKAFKEANKERSKAEGWGDHGDWIIRDANNQADRYIWENFPDAKAVELEMTEIPRLLEKARETGDMTPVQDMYDKITAMHAAKRKQLADWGDSLTADDVDKIIGGARASYDSYRDQTLSYLRWGDNSPETAEAIGRELMNSSAFDMYDVENNLIWHYRDVRKSPEHWGKAADKLGLYQADDMMDTFFELPSEVRGEFVKEAWEEIFELAKKRVALTDTRSPQAWDWYPSDELKIEGMDAIQAIKDVISDLGWGTPSMHQNIGHMVRESSSGADLLRRLAIKAVDETPFDSVKHSYHKLRLGAMDVIGPVMNRISDIQKPITGRSLVDEVDALDYKLESLGTMLADRARKGVPRDIPVIRDTNAWTEFALRRAIMEAEAQGYDTMTFARGLQAFDATYGVPTGQMAAYDKRMMSNLKKVAKEIGATLETKNPGQFASYGSNVPRIVQPRSMPDLFGGIDFIGADRLAAGWADVVKAGEANLSWTTVNNVDVPQTRIINPIKNRLEQILGKKRHDAVMTQADTNLADLVAESVDELADIMISGIKNGDYTDDVFTFEENIPRDLYMEAIDGMLKNREALRKWVYEKVVEPRMNKVTLELGPKTKSNIRQHGMRLPMAALGIPAGAYAYRAMQNQRANKRS